MKNTKTIDLKGKKYAEVKERVKEFRADNPRGSIKTTPEFMPDGQIHFTAYILKDKAEESSADATGHSFGANKGEKAFEKLETIAVGRALALLGYASDGEIASSEEMEEYEDYQQEKFQEAVLAIRERLEDSKNLEELKSTWADIPMSEAKQHESILDLKEELKVKLTPKIRTKTVVRKELVEVPVDETEA